MDDFSKAKSFFLSKKAIKNFDEVLEKDDRLPNSRKNSLGFLCLPYKRNDYHFYLVLEKNDGNMSRIWIPHIERKNFFHIFSSHLSKKMRKEFLLEFF